MQKSFTSVTEYETRKTQIGLTDADVEEHGCFAALSRATISIPDSARPPKSSRRMWTISTRRRSCRRAQARNQAAPTLDAARDYIHEALIQRSINEQADRWLSESRGRLRVEKFLEADAK